MENLQKLIENGKKIKFKDVHPGISDYLAHDCYCPNEVYGFDCFGYQLVYPEADAVVLGKYVYKDVTDVILVATHANLEPQEKHPLLAIVESDKDSPDVFEIKRCGLNQKNYEELVLFLTGQKQRFNVIDESEIEELRLLFNSCHVVMTD